MYKIFKFMYIIFTLLLTINAGFNVYGNELKFNSPKIDGFSQKSKPAYYSPDTLYEYINGAADLYLNYYFKKLSVFDYRDMNKGSITIDIYEHKDINNGFGIYCSEKPSKGDFLKIGTEGYYEKGILNFFKGKFYVKISSFGLKENEKNILVKVAESFSKQFKDKVGNPEIIKAFPETNKVENSEKYIAKNFLGHSFLHSAFTVDYKLDKAESQIFIIETQTESEIKKILKNYKLFLEKKNSILTKEDDIISFIDPYYKSKGNMYLKFRKNQLWGLFCKDKNKAIDILNLIDKKLK